MLLTKKDFWEVICIKLNIITLFQIKTATIKIRKTGKYIDLNILILERQVQIIAFITPHSFSYYIN